MVVTFLPATSDSLDLAGAHRLAVDMDRARAAQAGAAAEFGAGELEVLAHHPKQRRVRLGIRRSPDCR